MSDRWKGGRPDALVAVPVGLLATALFAVHALDTGRDLAQERDRLRHLAHYRRTVRHHHGRLLHAVVGFTNDVGSTHVAFVLAVFVCLALARTREWDRVVAVAAATYAVVFATTMGKLLIRHPAATTVAGHPVGTFPSGHAGDVTVVLGTVLLALAPLRYRAAAYVLAFGGGAIVGLLRVVSGAHTVDDGVGGWLIGVTAVLAAGAWLASREQRRVRG